MKKIISNLIQRSGFSEWLGNLIAGIVIVAFWLSVAYGILWWFDVLSSQNTAGDFKKAREICERLNESYSERVIDGCSNFTKKESDVDACVSLIDSEIRKEIDTCVDSVVQMSE